MWLHECPSLIICRCDGLGLSLFISCLGRTNALIKINVVYNDVFCIGCASSKFEQVFLAQLYELLEFLSVGLAVHWAFNRRLGCKTGTKRQLKFCEMHCLRAITGIRAGIRDYKFANKPVLFTSQRGSPTIE